MNPIHGFPTSLRIRHANEFKRVFANPKKFSGDRLTLLVRTNALNHPRLGLVIAKRHAKHAVTRNKLKRLIRETFRLQQQDLPAVDILVLTHKGTNNKPKMGNQKQTANEANFPSNQELRECLQRLFDKLTQHFSDS